VILAILAIVQDLTRTPNDQIWVARPQRALASELVMPGLSALHAA
jgi:hypothetical protein